MATSVGATEPNAQLVLVSWSNGRQDAICGFSALRDALEERPLDDVLSIRLEASGDTTSGVLVARKKIPGLMVQLEGGSESQILGAAELTFRRMMVGYVDRMGGWRSLAWMLTAFAPIVLASLAVSARDSNLLPRLAIMLPAGIGSLAAFSYSYKSILNGNPLMLYYELPERASFRGAINRGQSVINRPLVRPILGALGALTLGIIGNKIADLLPYP